MKGRQDRWLWLDEVNRCVRNRTVSSNAGYVAIVLGVHYVNGSCEAWPSQRELAAATGCSLATVKRALRELEQNELLEVTSRGFPAYTSGNSYHLRMGSHRPHSPEA